MSDSAAALLLSDAAVTDTSGSESHPKPEIPEVVVLVKYEVKEPPEQVLHRRNCHGYLHMASEQGDSDPDGHHLFHFDLRTALSMTAAA